MSLTETRPARVTDQPHMTAALHEAAASEGGMVLNEHYSFQDYVKRRSAYLAKHPIWKNSKVALFPVARHDAEHIFTSESEQLSVQEIRRREVHLHFLPSLPLPTTANTETIDNFQSYAPTEWTSTIEAFPPHSSVHHIQTSRVAVQDKRLPAALPTITAADHTSQELALPMSITVQPQGRKRISNSSHANDLTPTTAQSSSTPPSPRQMSARMSDYNKDYDASTSQTFEMQKPHPNLKAVIDPTTQAANFTKTIMPKPQTTGRRVSDLQSSSPSDTSHSSRRPSVQTSTQATSPFTMGDSDMASSPKGKTPLESTSNQDLIHKIIAKLGTGPNAPTAVTQPTQQDEASNAPRVPKYVTVSDGVSALGSRPMYVPVKGKPRTKRAAESAPEAAVDAGESISTEAYLEISPPPLKRLKLKPPKLESSSTRTEKRKQAKQVKKAAPKSTKRTSSNTTKAKPNHRELVISGAALPGSPKEAKEAAEHRYGRLRKVNNHHDLSPEFFDKNGFPRSTDEDEEPVRCVCGVDYDDEQGVMIACEECGVWQHIHCMGEGVPKDTTNGKYLCQMCDPWTHRELIAKLRREQPLGD